MQNNTFPTLFVGRSIQKLAEVDSTNNYLKTMLSNYGPPANGTVIMADHQTAGRGQYGSKWSTPPGKNLTVSFYLKTDFLTVTEQFNLNKAVSLAVKDCLTYFSVEDCKVKWPNDIYIKNKKIAGILIENRIRGVHLRDSIIGIGLNVNQNDFHDLIYATSLLNIKKKETDLEEVLMILSQYLESRFFELKSQKNLDEDYFNSLFLFNQISTFNSKGEIFTGKIIGVDVDGKLLIDTESELRSFNIKEVTFVL
ncbi:biotin/acetyl-CoA-carboxylase ligase [Pseudopedobacter saltans DSM 12145]|uniref:biotin--[biotin carboxyl-carrier protein] ligase n=1 Tax=Pseudopedobacter saltans (strain ATCC 51119 / DSM 12145 / JCM 21818 / CCUG 39354 / LMG 10337 / NBRC 100064 / NCIMB 13643) TaxID=762903 RepID=F0S9I8_PSESL|nr:biotin--[acetyl-CoA-carboxylase] ligase [Pseudopedobacter saltans]ADY53541.1 biotin/acetyl-CoA-carboxylase ligase [Pseudopedobacter saltans DSM 12145]